jgi:hypothetical protein
MVQHIFPLKSELQNNFLEAAPSSPSLSPTVSEKLALYASTVSSGLKHLTLLEGNEEETASALIRHFGSKKALSRASLQQIRRFLRRRKAEAVVAAFSVSMIADRGRDVGWYFFNNLLEVSGIKPDICSMATTRESKKKGGRPKLDKATISIRLSKDVLAQARRASASRGNLSAYIEEALRKELQIPNHAAPDFRERFSLPPKGPQVKGGLVQLILKEREVS